MKQNQSFSIWRSQRGYVLNPLAGKVSDNNSDEHSIAFIGKLKASLERSGRKASLRLMTP